MSIYLGILEYCLKKLFQICIRKVTEMKKTIYLAQASLSEDGRLVEITGREFYDIVTSVLGEKRYFVRLTDDIDYEGTEIIIEAPKDYYNEWRKEYRRHLDIRKANSLYKEVSYEDKVLTILDDLYEKDYVIDVIERKEDIEKLKRIYKCLTEQERFLIHMLYLTEYPISEGELAKILNISQQAVNKRKKKILSKLKKCWLKP